MACELWFSPGGSGHICDQTCGAGSDALIFGKCSQSGFHVSLFPWSRERSAGQDAASGVVGGTLVNTATIATNCSQAFVCLCGFLMRGKEVEDTDAMRVGGAEEFELLSAVRFYTGLRLKKLTQVTPSEHGQEACFSRFVSRHEEQPMGRKVTKRAEQ